MASFFDITSVGKQKEEDESWFPQLSFKERLIGFAFCFCLGYFIQLLSFGAFVGIIAGNPTKFALTYSFGNILALIGTGFLIGFKKQITNMADKERRISALIFFGSLLMVLISAFVLKSKVLVLIFLITEFCSYTWYAASYIPFARDCIKNCFKGVANSIK